MYLEERPLAPTVKRTTTRPSGQPESKGGQPKPGESDRSESNVRKHFVLDTNVLLHNPNAIFMFAEHEVVIPMAVIEELDRFKKNNDDTGRNARQVIRQIDKLRQEGRLFEGVPLNSLGGTLRLDRCDRSAPFALDLNEADNRILAVAHAIHEQGEHTVFISMDINARVKGDALGLRVEDFEAQKVDADWLYTGMLEVTVPSTVIDELYNERQIAVTAIEQYLFIEGENGEQIKITPLANQFFLLRAAEDESHTGLARLLAETDHLIPISGPRRPTFGIMARNVEQTMALDLLLDDEIKLVTLLGAAGTGKTLLAMAAGMHKVFKEQRYDKLLAARPIMPLGRDIGYLPGDKDEKLAMWMQPIFDNLAYLLSTRGSDISQHAESHTTEQRINQLIAGGTLVLEPLTYIRGRSIPHQFMIVDEVQNLTPHEVKTIVSRVGDGTKIILTGDINQIDNPYLDGSSNGLSYLVERMKGQGISGHITMAKTERSSLASLAAEIL
ncbi:MAG: PhoH family protein [Phycisphaerales bacterium]|nr:MAG: PhoH family protein [Phycisphaerales bacterium]